MHKHQPCWHEVALLSVIFWLPSFDHDGIKGVDLEIQATLRPAARFVQDHFSPSRFLLLPGVICIFLSSLEENRIEMRQVDRKIRKRMQIKKYEKREMDRNL